MTHRTKIVASHSVRKAKAKILKRRNLRDPKTPFEQPSQGVEEFLRSFEFVPQAIVAGDVATLARRSHSQVIVNRDDFDEFTGTGFYIEKLPVAIMRYRGHPEHTSTIYLPFEMQDIETIKAAVAQVVTALHLPSAAVQWQRGNEG